MIDCTVLLVAEFTLISWERINLMKKKKQLNSNHRRGRFEILIWSFFFFFFLLYILNVVQCFAYSCFTIVGILLNWKPQGMCIFFPFFLFFEIWFSTIFFLINWHRRKKCKWKEPLKWFICYPTDWSLQPKKNVSFSNKYRKMDFT